MRNKHLMLLLLSSCCFVACVDNKYDLGKVESDGVTIGEKWTAPLGKGSITTDDVIDREKVPSIKVIDGVFTMLYKGELVTNKTGLRSMRTPMITVASVDIPTGDLEDLFEGDFYLDLANPHLTLENLSMESGSLDCQLDIEGINRTKEVLSTSDFTLLPTTPNIWLGPTDPNLSDFTFVRNESLPEIIAIIPNIIRLALNVDPLQWENIAAGDLDVLPYKVEIPFIPAKNFRAESSELLKDAFSQDLVDYLFDSGSVTIYGKVTNEMPFDLSVGMTILDSSMQNVGIAFGDPQKIEGVEGSVSFKFDKADLKKMRNAKHIQMDLYLSGREKEEPLKEGQKIAFDLKLEKEGGITL